MPRDHIPTQSPRWFIFRVIAGRERRVIERLAEASIEAYTPIEERRRRRPGDKPQAVPLLPGYVMARVVKAGQAWWAAIDTEEVVGALEIAGAYGALSDTEIGELRAMANERGAIPEKAVSKFQRGAWVRATEGPFSGFDGDVLRTGVKVVERHDYTGRVVAVEREPYAVVMLSVFGRRSKVDLFLTQLEMA